MRELHRENLIAKYVTFYRPESVHPRSTFIMDGCIRPVLVELYVNGTLCAKSIDACLAARFFPSSENERKILCS